MILMLNVTTLMEVSFAYAMLDIVVVDLTVKVRKVARCYTCMIFRSLLDIDECGESGDNNCDLVNGRCNNTSGSFNCFCNAGYAGDGVNCTSKL